MYIVESAVSSVEEIQSSDRPLKDENVEKLNFIATNGPHPLVSMNLVDDMLFLAKNGNLRDLPLPIRNGLCQK